jgi:hypothetical protein
MKKTFNLKLSCQKLKLQGKLHQTYSHTHLKFRLNGQNESKHIEVDLSKAWFVMGKTNEHK